MYDPAPNASDHIPDDGPDHGLREYIVGFALAVILTIIPFGVVAAGVLARGPALAVIAIAAIVQLLVHLRYFLHLDLKTTPRENLWSIVFAAVLIFIMLGGSFWIMADLHHRMSM